jgi:HD-GYP domain-containing protein (c-di-GMP phosphodiesterase class II)
MKNETIQLARNKLYGSNAYELRHSENVGKWCQDIGKAMGLNQNILEDLSLIGRMHDIGKIGIQTGILNKTERLDHSDWLEIKRHPEIGYQILRSADEYVHVAEAVLSHHEWFDGTGYPRNLKGDEIPLTARITAVAEAYEIMVNGSVFRKPLAWQEAKEELIRNSGVQFDHQIVDIFITKVLEV